MAKVKIFLEPGETQEAAQEALVKALTAQDNGDTHEDKFMDPVMEASADKMKDEFRRINAEMYAEIEEVLDRESL